VPGSFTQAWAEAQADVPAHFVDLVGLELIHPAFLTSGGSPTSVRAVNDTQDHVLPLESDAPLDPGASVTFTAIPFEIPWPGQEEGRAADITVRVDYVGRDLQPWLDAATAQSTPVTVILRAWTYNTTTGEKLLGIDPIHFALRDITVTETAIEGRASVADLANVRTLREIYDLERFPGLEGPQT
jgi:hypothetical protein